MTLYFEAIKDEVIKENLKLDENETIEYRFLDRVKRTDVTIFFTEKRCGWIARYKGEFYGALVSEIVEQDKYTLIDVFKTIRENAIDSLKALYEGTPDTN